ncbi:MAG: apolipoprotein N-acyltransferase [Verrucomicrobia bacterium CG_4_10_14_3_um_filter_43_23]|nr:MAG: apolipoprotein N-acyltransferase [Verrucomicrobia bacterium CG1_02_43_26]PIP58936.1 MAG: apolipoprotein N-acyltransferase [Verrucomicrobia bacterium CG22_combo_CG10-13_8_21_14_all_43_17]PIX57663.1 MAG: apolipoprotein N-acyltransferase [Verrucomicrobia bacterium CG_4_10_14_3_um_filter_43_23]PIY61798.1 MAG: apolipoprotein N-acyltransferase [Verrucomicrobia bacterium CG_4_10_14_0_8_um_filter_43_34]PJA44747.1 MAG: apolipoprotein N-acyltransferase [Verrucomicrobia bacterium CG_4_9_14_3_um_fi
MFVKKHGSAILAAALSAILYYAAFAQFDAPEAAYVFAVPLLLWAFFKPSFKHYLIATLISGWVAWFFNIIWLSNITWLGTIGLAFILALYYSAWFLVARLVIIKSANKGLIHRLYDMIALAAFWVVLEWIRGVVLLRFPWLALAVSQWQRPILLQIISWTGSYGLSFVLIFFNLGIAYFLANICNREQTPISRYLRTTPEFLLAMVLLLGLIIFSIKQTPKHRKQELLFTAGISQPYILPSTHEDSKLSRENFMVLQEQTLLLQTLHPDVILWPEAAVPTAIFDNELGTRKWVEYLCNSINIPILFGALADYQNQGWYNGIFLALPQKGLDKNYYAKRKPVPFGEYVPLRFLLPFLERVVPGEWDIIPGNNIKPIQLPVRDKIVRIGGLVCYEDVFPDLSRESVRAGSDVLLVLTNNAWFGEGSGAYQHAAHAALRAVENRRPIVRCGNGGWSGWIDEYGNTREVVTNSENSIYFRGIGKLTVTVDPDWWRRESVFTRHGNWFAYLCIGICLPRLLALAFLLFPRQNHIY